MDLFYTGSRWRKLEVVVVVVVVVIVVVVIVVVVAAAVIVKEKLTYLLYVFAILYNIKFLLSFDLNVVRSKLFR